MPFSVVLSAAPAQQPSLRSLVQVVRGALERRGDVKHFELDTMKLAFCQGEFDCWVKTPGSCRAHDHEQDIVQAIHDADRLVLVDAVTFGGHGSTLKRAQDRLICLISPFFEKRAQLTHHAARYQKRADFFAVGWLPIPDAAQAETFEALADGNAVNLLAPHVGTAVVDDSARAQWPSAIAKMLASTEVPGAGRQPRASLREALLAAARPEVSVGAEPVMPTKTAAILVGSAKIRGTSLSENLANAMKARLERAGVSVQVHTATEFVHDSPRARAAATAIAAADLFVLATPLYVDALPALATHALELVASARRDAPSPARVLTLVNCGFPEPEHNRTALHIARHFARAAGYHWAGGLALGGGGAIDPRVPVDEQGGRTAHLKRALDLSMTALADGFVVPELALQAMLESPIPDAVYRALGDLGWRYQAWRNGLAQKELRARPLEPKG